MSAADRSPTPLHPAKFRDPDVTAKGEPRARVALRRLDTLWFNTGSLCNITCATCYIESSPTNDRLAYLSAAEVAHCLAEAEALGHRPAEVGFTGGEPFMNPAFPEMLAETLRAGYRVLVLTNAMQPLMRPRVQTALTTLPEAARGQLTLRVSLDHFAPGPHDKERGAGSFDIALQGMRWLTGHGFRLAVAGRLSFGAGEAALRDGFARLFAAEGLAIDAADPGQLVLFPEMDASADVPEITTACWGILNTSPDSVMCATSRMVVKRKGAAAPSIVPCTLLPYDLRFDLGPRLAGALGAVPLNHPHCATFCVLGGASCS